MPLDFKDPVDGPKGGKAKGSLPSKKAQKEHGKPATMHLETQVVPELIGKVRRKILLRQFLM